MSGAFQAKLALGDRFPAEWFAPTLAYIRATQRADGSIPWETDQKLDPWDHVESAIGLTIGGFYDEARAAYDWLARTQMGDGSWWPEYLNGVVVDATRKESNFTAYVATGVWHYFLVTGDRDFLARHWPMVKRAIQYVLALQTKQGEVLWAGEPDGTPGRDALITGNASIHKSLECAYLMSVEMGEARPEWMTARARVGEAVRTKPGRFDRTWDSKARYSMDWFYPVLTGIYTQAEAKARLEARWDEFVVEGLGCRCVSDEPWVTFAETCELIMALCAAGERDRAAEIFSWIHRYRSDNGGYWMGYQFKLDIIWPEERPAWTSAAALLAADALTGHTKASHLFTEPASTDPAS